MGKPALFPLVHALVLGAFLATVVGQEGQRPNLIVFLVDDMGWQDTSVPFAAEPTYWNRTYRTPNMERLAAMGCVFTDAYAACCVCSPTRTALLSGRYPARTHITNWVSTVTKRDGNHLHSCPPDWCAAGLQPNDGHPKLPAILADDGYRTIHAGKAHFGAAGTDGADPCRLGFQVNIGGSHAGSPSGYYPTPGWRDRHPGLEAYLDQDIDINAAITIEANKEIDRAVADGTPFFLHLAHYAVHTPIQAIRPFVDRYDQAGLPPVEARYASMIESMDASLGRILDNLVEEKILDNTFILFLSDNGGLSNHTRATTGGPYVLDGHNRPIRSGKGAAYEGGTRTPMIVYWPRIVRAGSRSSLPVITTDVLPTLLSVAGVPDSLRPEGALDGIDLTPILRGESDGDRQRPLFWHYPHQWYRDIGVGDGIEPYSSVRRGRWKLYYFYSDRRWELYDLQADLGEERDVIKQEPGAAAELSRLLVSWLNDVGAQMPVDKSSGQAVPVPTPLSASSEVGRVRSADDVTATFSIVAADPESGVCGAAVASKYPAVGRVVPYVRGGVGAFCTQHWHEPKWGERALDMLADGMLPENVLGELLRDDPARDKRQLAIIDMQGRAANRNPVAADPSGIYWGAETGRYYACQGNTLAGRQVIVSMAKAYEETEGSLADRLMAALTAGDQAGGDHRGRLAAGIRVAKQGVSGYWLELQVEKSNDAVAELTRQYEALEHPAKGNP